MGGRVVHQFSLLARKEEKLPCRLGLWLVAYPQNPTSFHAHWPQSSAQVTSWFPPGLAAVAAINTAIQKGVAEKTVLELMNPEAQLPQVYPFAADLYQKELATLQQQSPEVSRLTCSSPNCSDSQPDFVAL